MGAWGPKWHCGHFAWRHQPSRWGAELPMAQPHSICGNGTHFAKPPWGMAKGHTANGGFWWWLAGTPTFNCGAAGGCGLHPGTHGTQLASAPPLGIVLPIGMPCMCPHLPPALLGHGVESAQSGTLWHFPQCSAVAAAALCGPPWPPTPHPLALLVQTKGHGMHIGHPNPTLQSRHIYWPQYVLYSNQRAALPTAVEG